jgi:GrpB-like predicted nucleotidyltransferase (UPF0157 family)
MLGLPKGRVFLIDYTEEWATEYRKESERIIRLIGSKITGIRHIGSTAVPGLKAKPIIDIAAELADFKYGFLCKRPLKTIGYRHRIISELPERHYFSKGDPRTHQIHMFGPESKYLWEQIAFRDKLRSHPDLMKEYQELKEKLSSQYSTDKLAYADAKTEFINSVVYAT